MSGHEFDCLRLDIKENGQREPIIIHDGMILDGGNRYRACIDLGVEPSLMKFGGDSIATYVLSANLHRRHLTPGQQAAIVACVQDWTKAQSVGKPKSGNVTGLQTVATRTAISGASEKTQRTADKVAKANPELAKKVGRGEITLPQAEKQAFPKAEKDENHYDPSEDALANAHETVIALSEENQQLKDAIAAGQPEAEQSAGEIISGLRSKVKTLEVTLAATESQRDSLLRENGELKKQCAMQRREIKKLGGKNA
jgi:hypothetical protein